MCLIQWGLENQKYLVFRWSNVFGLMSWLFKNQTWLVWTAYNIKKIIYIKWSRLTTILMVCSFVCSSTLSMCLNGPFKNGALPNPNIKTLGNRKGSDSGRLEFESPLYNGRAKNKDLNSRHIQIVCHLDVYYSNPVSITLGEHNSW